MRPYMVKENRRLIQEDGMGDSGHKWAALIARIAKEHSCSTVLDYGAGQMTFAKQLKKKAPKLECWNYDPAVEEIAELPGGKFDIVICTDVLEHVELNDLPWVISRVRWYAEKACLVVVSCKTSRRWLSDGRNAHITIRHPSWWRDLLDCAFNATSEEVEASRKNEVALLWIF